MAMSMVTQPMPPHPLPVLQRRGCWEVNFQVGYSQPWRSLGRERSQDLHFIFAGLAAAGLVAPLTAMSAGPSAQQHIRDSRQKSLRPLGQRGGREEGEEEREERQHPGLQATHLGCAPPQNRVAGRGKKDFVSLSYLCTVGTGWQTEATAAVRSKQNTCRCLPL